MSDWLDYQKLTASIYAELEPGSQVTHDDMILGVESHILRQIDVAIRTTVAGHNVLIIVDAKNHSRPLDVNAIGAFASVVRDVRASKGVLVCNSEFTSTAVEYAAGLGIDLCTVHDAASKSWGMTLRFPLLWIENEVTLDVEWSLLALQANEKELRFPTRVLDYRFFKGRNGTAVPVFEKFVEDFNAHRIVKDPHVRHKWPVDCDDLHVLIDGDSWFRLEFLNLGYQLQPTAWHGQFQVAQCRGLRNITTGELRTRLGIRPSDIPKMRDAGWTAVDNIKDFVSKAAALVTIEHSGVDLKDVLIDGIELEPS